VFLKNGSIYQGWIFLSLFHKILKMTIHASDIILE